ncbi:MAG: TlpA disulfide reductase family protein, partial [Planctomycetota bacterium]
LDRLVHYVTLPIAAEIINRTPGGFPDRMVEPALRKIVASPKAKPKVRQASRLTLAQWLIRWNDFVKHRDKQAEALAKLQRIKSPTVEERSQMSSLEAIHRSLPSNDENRRWQVEAESLLADLEASKRSTKIPELKAVGRHIVRIDLEATKDKATIAELARATRFNRVGNSVGELGANLINGERWNLIAKAGDVVILQFSFTGCLPCIKMYQELADLQSKHPEELSLLTVMQDPQEQDTKETAAKYELSWSVCWDGDPGDITQRFTIQSFPAVVVLDREGKIVGRTLDDARRLLEGSSALRAE